MSAHSCNVMDLLYFSLRELTLVSEKKRGISTTALAFPRSVVMLGNPLLVMIVSPGFTSLSKSECTVTKASKHLPPYV